MKIMTQKQTIATSSSHYDDEEEMAWPPKEPLVQKPAQAHQRGSMDGSMTEVSSCSSFGWSGSDLDVHLLLPADNAASEPQQQQPSQQQQRPVRRKTRRIAVRNIKNIPTVVEEAASASTTSSTGGKPKRRILVKKTKKSGTASASGLAGLGAFLEKHADNKNKPTGGSKSVGGGTARARRTKSVGGEDAKSVSTDIVASSPSKRKTRTKSTGERAVPIRSSSSTSRPQRPISSTAQLIKEYNNILAAFEHEEDDDLSVVTEGPPPPRTTTTPRAPRTPGSTTTTTSKRPVHAHLLETLPQTPPLLLSTPSQSSKSYASSRKSHKMPTRTALQMLDDYDQILDDFSESDHMTLPDELLLKKK